MQLNLIFGMKKMMKKIYLMNWAMSVMTIPLLCSCVADEVICDEGRSNGVISFDVHVNAGAPEVKPMGGATRSGDRADSSATGNAVMSPDLEGFFPTSSVELSSVDGKTLYANCDERSGINKHNEVDYKAMRGNVIDENNFYSSFALYGYLYDYDSKWLNVSGSTNVDKNINGIAITKGPDKIWKASNVYWKGASYKAAFFAIAPYASTAVVSSDKGEPRITYSVPDEIVNQEDLLIAKITDVKCDGKQTNLLTFNHVLASIKFMQGNELGDYSRISKVEIIGVNNKGTLNSFDEPIWTNLCKDETIPNKYTITDLTNQVMFLMPQKVPITGAKIIVTFTDGANTKKYEADLNNTVWQGGYQYTYNLSIDKITGTFNFTVDNVCVDQNTTSANISISSFFSLTMLQIKRYP